MYKVNILGKNYKIYTVLNEKEVQEVVTEINEKYRQFENEYKTLDKVDILIFYIFELYETIFNLKKDIKKNLSITDKIKSKIEKIEKEIENTLLNLTEIKEE